MRKAGCEFADQIVGRSRRRLHGTQPLLEALDGLPQAVALHRLDEVVERAARERLDRVLLEGGDEHEVSPVADRARGLDA